MEKEWETNSVGDVYTDGVAVVRSGDRWIVDGAFNSNYAWVRFKPTITEARAVLRMGTQSRSIDDGYTREQVHAWIREHGTAEECESITPHGECPGCSAAICDDYLAGCERRGYGTPTREAHWWHSDCLAKHQPSPVEAPRASGEWRVGDRVRGNFSGATGVIDHIDEWGRIYAQRDDGYGGMNGRPHMFTPAPSEPTAPRGEPEWLAEERRRLPVGWSARYEATRLRLIAGKMYVYITSPCGTQLRDLNRGGRPSLGLETRKEFAENVESQVRELASRLGLPDPYATPTVIDGTAYLPPATTEPPAPKPDLSLTNEIGLPKRPELPPARVSFAERAWNPETMEHRGACKLYGEHGSYPCPACERTVTFDEGESLDAWAAAQRAEVKPVPQLGDLVKWGPNKVERGIVSPVPIGCEARDGYLWARRKADGLPCMSCVAVSQCTVITKAGDR